MVDEGLGEEDVHDEEEIKEEINDVTEVVRQQPSNSDVTFGSIPKTASRSHLLSVDNEKLALVTNRKLKWK